MAGFNSWDSILAGATVSGKVFKSPHNKNFLPTTAATAGEHHVLARGAGSPPADALFNTGTNLLFQSVRDSTTSAGAMQHGGDVSPDYKYLRYGSFGSAAATTAPAFAYLIDIVGFYRVTSVTTTGNQATTNTLQSLGTFTADASTDIITHSNINILPYTRVQFTTTTTRPAGLSLATDYYTIYVSDTTFKVATSYANAVAGTAVNITDAGTGTHTINSLYQRWTNGFGLQTMAWNTNATAMGAATPNLSVTYRNQAYTSNTTPTVLPACKTAAANGLVLYSGTGAGKYNYAMPMVSGDYGVRQVDQINLSATYSSGEFSVAVFKQIAEFNYTTLGVVCERDFIHQSGGPPRIPDGAALYWVVGSGAATPTNSGYVGSLDFFWG